ncbi:MAG: hypothetical protein COS76_02465 [Candidatus Portnoybacteria bacterium CG06_land_8_20_14_3_00_39_12]|uniref:Uncharacterized protein n=1 Tax=Candidatus Portnoybacteria bacterium CG06_land_8_20_14_3_00_39_12 TaxID=1974809 RepID=A0A2M7AWZ1_9BACT|nr:MAG: hypothetical protein COS76_02465 [Candidatus Portnoybacteria bacterium CG06_land_8_20_14_3_00_39_12]
MRNTPEMVYEGQTLELANMYGIFAENPKFGNNVKLPLRINDTGGIRDVPPTIGNLLIHFGELQTVTERARQCIEKNIALNIWEIEALNEARKDIFLRKCVLKMRRDIEQRKKDRIDFWFRLIPGGEFFPKNIITGALEYNGLDFKHQVLTVLPKHPKTATERYGLKPEELFVLAPQVLYVILWLCRFNTQVKSSYDATLLLNRWDQYLQQPYSENWTQRLKAYPKLPVISR